MIKTLFVVVVVVSNYHLFPIRCRRRAHSKVLMLALMVSLDHFRFNGLLDGLLFAIFFPHYYYYYYN